MLPLLVRRRPGALSTAVPSADLISGSGLTALALDRNGDGVADISIEIDGDHHAHNSFVGLTL